MHTLINSLWIFIFFGFIAWLAEFIARSIKKKRLVNPGFITLPFSIGFGSFVVLEYLLFSRVQNIIMLFFGSAIFLTSLKYILSLFFEKTFGFKWKDYSKRKLNLNGYVDVWEAVGFGNVSILLVLWGFKPVIAFANSMPWWISLLISAIITGLIITDFIVSIITVLLLKRHLKQMNNISALLEDNKSDKSDDELRNTYEKRMIKNKVFRQRLVNAFPDMQSLNYEKQFNDLKNHLDGIREKNDEEYEKKNDDKVKSFAYGLNFTKLFWLFVAGCVAGTILETIWALCTLGHFEIRTGLVWGPFIPVYGGGAVLITLCLYKLHKAKDIIIYLASAVIGATFEYFCSFFQEKFLGTVSWNYSDTPFNIDGRTNLMFGLIWGLLGLCWLRYIYPSFSRIVEKIPIKKGNIITIILVVFMVVDSGVSMVAVYRKAKRADGVKPQNIIEETIDYCFNDDYMNLIFPHMCKPEDWGKDTKAK